MSALWQKFVMWLRNKFGRIVTWIGSVSLIFQFIDPAPLREPLKNLLGDAAGTKLFGGLALLCLILSFSRHQQVANRVKKIEDPLPSPPSG